MGGSWNVNITKLISRSLFSKAVNQGEGESPKIGQLSLWTTPKVSRTGPNQVLRPNKVSGTGPNQFLRPNKVSSIGPNQVLRPKKELKTGLNQL